MDTLTTTLFSSPNPTSEVEYRRILLEGLWHRRHNKYFVHFAGARLVLRTMPMRAFYPK